ncbi:MAG: serpin family protein [Chloroflexia bacterium]|nr:serpin family protein [Chloroflexia bacterium]
MKKRCLDKGVSALLLLVFLVLGACAGTSPTENGATTSPEPVEHTTETYMNLIQSNKPRLAPPSMEEARVAELVGGNTVFALDLYQALFSPQENLFCSPHSISIALAMTYAGARGETERQMAAALHYTLPQAQLHPAFNALDQALLERGQGAEEGAFRLHLVNALWGDSEETYLEAFLDSLAQHYGAGLRIVDLQQAEEARRIINQWVSQQTEQRIEELLPPNSIDGETALVLTNAIYFKASWKYPFTEDNTQEGAFFLLDGSQVTIPLMEQVAELAYAERPGLQAVELPYAGDELSMVVMLPEQGTFEAFARGLEAGELTSLLQELQPASVRLTMPRFRFDSELKLKDALLGLGMVDAFGGEADFSGIDGTKELFIEQIYHQAFVAVDEAGTEAAAATAVVMARKSGPAVEQEIRVDRPFLFLIRDRESGAILFLGHVLNPSL